MRILAIETSCDETSSSIVEQKNNKTTVLSNITSSSIKLHAETGGIIPERAAREQIKYILPTIIEALLKTRKDSGNLNKKEKFQTANNILREEIDKIAVTIGPGLIGSLLVGVETAKTLSYVLNKPIIPVNHLLGHIYANFIKDDLKFEIDFPFVGLIVSGGHTDLLLFKSHTQYKWLGGTRDDAAGESMDKIARILGIGYPGGPEIEKRAKFGTPGVFNFPSPMIGSNDFDFSFSGLKTAVQRETKIMGQLNNGTINDISFAVQKAIMDVLVKKTIMAAEKYEVKTIVMGGGVSANKTLREEMGKNFQLSTLNSQLIVPQAQYCTDNAAMIGAYALLSGKPTSWQKIKANPELYFA